MYRVTGHDKAGSRTTFVNADGITTYVFDASGTLTSMVYPATSSYRTNTFATDSNGRRTDEWLNSTTGNADWDAHTHTTYDGSGRVSEVVGQAGRASSATTVVDVRYCYNTGGSGTSCGTTSTQDRSKVQWTYDAISGQTTKYTYDGSARLTGVAQSGGSGSNNTYGYTYNANGDRTGVTVTGSSSSSQSLTYNAADQITTSGYSYDGAGNLTASPGKTFSYNAAEQMTGATVGSTIYTYTYTYAGASQSEVLSITGGSQSRSYTYGASDATGVPELAVYNNSAASTPTLVYSDPGTGQSIMTVEQGTIYAALYVDDGIGNPIALIENWDSVSQANTYDPYGVETISSGSVTDVVAHNPYTFKGGIKDTATGFVKFGQRWGTTSTGAWTQQDTLDAPLDPSNANRYAYAGDDPINNSDPTGQLSGTEALGECLVNGGIGLAFGALSGPQDALIGFAIGCASGIIIAHLREEGYGSLSDGLEAGDYTHLGYELAEFLTDFL